MTWGWFQGGFKPTRPTARRGARAIDPRNVAGATVPTTRPTTSRSSTTRRPPTRPPAAELGRRDRHDRPGQPPVRPERLRRRRLAAGNLPQVSFLKAAVVRGRPPGLLRPARRAALHRQRGSTRSSSRRTGTSTAMIITYDDSDGWYDHVFHAPTNHRSPRRTSSPAPATAATRWPSRRSAASTTAAAPARACRSSSSRPGPSRTTSTTRTSTRPRSCASSRTTGACPGSATTPTTRSPATCRACSTSPLPPARRPKLTLDAINGSGRRCHHCRAPTAHDDDHDDGHRLRPPPRRRRPRRPSRRRSPSSSAPSSPSRPRRRPRALRLSFKVTGLSASKGKITVSVKLTLGKQDDRQRPRAPCTPGKVTVTLKSKNAAEERDLHAVDDGQPGRQVGEVLQDAAPALTQGSDRSGFSAPSGAPSRRRNMTLTRPWGDASFAYAKRLIGFPRSIACNETRTRMHNAMNPPCLPPPGSRRGGGPS